MFHCRNVVWSDRWKMTIWCNFTMRTETMVLSKSWIVRRTWVSAAAALRSSKSSVMSIKVPNMS